MKYKVIIIDDEKNARNLLQGMLGEYVPDVEILEMCPDLQSGVKAIYKHKPDLVFLDIEMPGHSGLELLDFFETETIDFSIIFTTAYNEYAIQAFKLSAIDYLLKPIEPDALETAMELFRKKENKSDISALKENLKPGKPLKIALNTSGSIKFASLDDITYLKGEGAYTEFHFSDGTLLLVSRNLKYYEDAFAVQTHFFRCHKSYIVNLDFVSSYVKSDGGYILMKNGEQINISTEKIPEMMQLMSNLSR